MKKYKVLYEQMVDCDLREAKSYYKKISPDLAKRFFQDFRQSKNFISEFPFANDVVYGEDIRLHLLKKFPYHIHYIVKKKESLVIILAVIFGGKGDLVFSQRR